MQIDWTRESGEELAEWLSYNIFTNFVEREPEVVESWRKFRNPAQEQTLQAIITSLVRNLLRPTQHEEIESLEVNWNSCPFPLGPDAELEAGGEDPRYVIQVLEKLDYVQCSWPGPWISSKAQARPICIGRIVPHMHVTGSDLYPRRG